MSQSVEGGCRVQQEPCNGVFDTDTFAATTLNKRVEAYVKSAIENKRSEINSRIFPTVKARFSVVMMEDVIRMILTCIN